MERKPYVISAELDLKDVSANETVKMKELDSFRENLDRDLCAQGKEVMWMPSGILRRRLGALAYTSPLPIISLDDRYLNVRNDVMIGMSRGVRYDESGQLVDAGYVPRVGYDPISDQIDSAVRRIGKKEVAIVDDVVFSGEMIKKLAIELSKRGVDLKEVICGIGIGEGIERLTGLGINVRAGQVFDEVEDEICERDFSLTRGSGRRLISSPEYPNGANILYFDKRYGRPTEWASIPADRAQEFWRRNLGRNRALLQTDVPMKEVGEFIGFNAEATLGQAIKQVFKEGGPSMDFFALLDGVA